MKLRKAELASIEDYISESKNLTILHEQVRRTAAHALRCRSGASRVQGKMGSPCGFDVHRLCRGHHAPSSRRPLPKIITRT